MNIACVIREPRRWGFNGLLTGLLNTGSTMERNRGEEVRGGEGGTKILTDRELREGDRKSEDGNERSESKGKEK